MTKTSTEERRSSIRISPKGSVVISTGAARHRARISNISRHGMLAVTEARADLADRDIEVQLRLDDAQAEWMYLSGRVIRIDDCEVAISFTTVPDAFADLIVDSSSASHGHTTYPSVILSCSRWRRVRGKGVISSDSTAPSRPHLRFSNVDMPNFCLSWWCRSARL